MVVLQIEHGVREYEVWKTAFDSDPVGREAGGVRSYRIMRPAGDQGRVVIELEFDAMARAEAFREKLRQLWARPARASVSTIRAHESSRSSRAPHRVRGS